MLTGFIVFSLLVFQTFPSGKLSFLIRRYISTFVQTKTRHSRFHYTSRCDNDFDSPCKAWRQTLICTADYLFFIYFTLATFERLHQLTWQQDSLYKLIFKALLMILHLLNEHLQFLVFEPQYFYLFTSYLISKTLNLTYKPTGSCCNGFFKSIQIII